MSSEHASIVLERALAAGFDKSRIYPDTDPDGEENGNSVSVRCSGCDAVVINGVPCHETGCYNPEAR